MQVPNKGTPILSVDKALEQMAREGDLADAADAYVSLRREIQDLDEALAKLMGEFS